MHNIQKNSFETSMSESSTLNIFYSRYIGLTSLVGSNTSVSNIKSNLFVCLSIKVLLVEGRLKILVMYLSIHYRPSYPRVYPFIYQVGTMIEQ